MAEFKNVLQLVADALLYFVVLASLLRARTRIGLGAFFCALGVMHFLETYLARILYVSLPFGIVTSPGSTVLFTGKLMMLLLLLFARTQSSSDSRFTAFYLAMCYSSRLHISCVSTLRLR
jgi:Vitamin uptake-like sensor